MRTSTAWSGLATGTRWPLTLLLTVQSVLTLRLIWSNTAFSDEALYLWAGRVELAHLLHGSQVPEFASYFSGSPVLYPPLGALAASIGGLPGARLLSLVMMLATTAMLYDVSRRLFDRRSAFFAAALFAGLAGTQFLGALATYDSMALGLIALAAWLAVVAADACGPRAAALLTAAGAVLALADATKYAALLFNPVVVGVAVLAAWRARGRDAALRTAVIATGTLAVLFGCVLLAGGRPLARGLTATTLDRPAGDYSATFLLMASARWLWLVAPLAAIGVAAAATARRGPAFAFLAAVLALAVGLPSAEQARIHTYTSLFKHDDYGAWFGCAIAGYALAALSRAVPPDKALAAFRAGVVVVALAALPGILVAGQQYRWPNTAQLIATAQRAIAAHKGPILADDDGDLLHFYLGSEVSGEPVAGTWYISYRGPGDRAPRHGLTGYADAIRHRYFAVVMLEFSDNLATDRQIERDLATSRAYRLAAELPFSASGGPRESMIWVRT